VTNPYRRPDRFTRQARAEGYAARSVYKLDDIQQRHKLFRPGQRVVDLGCFPGSWSRFLLQTVGRSGRVVGVDLEEPQLPGGTWIVRSVLEVSAEELRAALGGPADAVVSDMAPRTTGQRLHDHVLQIELADRALELAVALLAPGGSFVCKVFDGEDAPAFVDRVKARFERLKRARPEAVRKNSREFFVVAEGFRG
jgi:23S rRNA (uridine2552-2'-O)-methyltransferase